MSRKAVIYARVSSKNDRQSTERQVAELQAFAQSAGLEVFTTFEEMESGAVDDRPVLQNCITFLKMNPEFCLLISEVSRLGRSVSLVRQTIDSLTAAGVAVFIKDINLWTLDGEGKENPIASMLLTILSLGAEMERKNILGRLNSGRTLAKSKGVRMGRPVGSSLTAKELQDKYPEVVRRLRKGQSIRDVAQLCNISQSTVQRVKKTIK